MLCNSFGVIAMRFGFAVSLLHMFSNQEFKGVDSLLRNATRGIGRQGERRTKGSQIATALLALLSGLLFLDSAYAGVIFTDSFEDGKKYADPAGYGGRLANIDPTGARTGTNSLFFNNKEGALWTLDDTYQVGTYTVTYYARRESGFSHTLGLLSYGITGVTGGYQPDLGSAYFPETNLPMDTYVPVTFSAVIAPGSLAIGQNIKLLIEQSRLWQDDTLYKIRVDDVSITYTPAGNGEVPEPTSMAIFGLGALGLAYRARRKSKA